MAGKPVHVEIPAADTEKASAFWCGLFGWELQGFEDAPSPYLMTRFSEDTGGAIFEAEGDARGLRVYFDVDDIGAGASRVRELGGEAGGAMPVPGMGWFAHCTDVSGNEFGLWQTNPSASL
jgi:predicted enzyme related to lactoylglutathione lyase